MYQSVLQLFYRLWGLLLTLKPRRIPSRRLHGAPFLQISYAARLGSGRCWATAGHPSAWCAPPLSGLPRYQPLEKWRSMIVYRQTPRDYLLLRNKLPAAAMNLEREQDPIRSRYLWLLLVYIQSKVCKCLEQVALVTHSYSVGGDGTISNSSCLSRKLRRMQMLNICSIPRPLIGIM